MEDLETKAKKYIALEEEAWNKIRISVPENSALHDIAEDFLHMAHDYFEDAKTFYSKGDLINAVAAASYSYGWLDAGVRMGILEGSGDHRLFVHYR